MKTKGSPKTPNYSKVTKKKVRKVLQPKKANEHTTKVFLLLSKCFNPLLLVSSPRLGTPLKVSTP